jgi:hypothetical protein
MTLKKLPKEYFQKSRIFLYPTLGIRKGSNITPEETYIAWEEFVTPKDRKLICVYKSQDTDEYKAFERSKLINNKRFDNIMQTVDNRSIYIFSFENDSVDFDNFINGKYSSLSPTFKKIIEEYYGKSSVSYEFVMSYLYPEDYFKIYSEILNVDINLLKSVGELCAPVDVDKETLKLSIEDMPNPKLLI